VILYLVCCVGVIGQGLASIPQTKSLKFIAYCKTLFLGLHGLLNLKQKSSTKLMVVLDIEIVHRYLILVNHSLTSLMTLAFKFHMNLIF
jgi:hypothetical protein